MRASEFAVESVASISNSNSGGSLEGYITDTTQPQLENYLSGQGADNNLIKTLKNKYNKVGIIRNMYIDPDQRNQGHGGDLLGGAIDDAFSLGADAIVLVADRCEDNAIDLAQWYTEYGFEAVGNAHGNIIMVIEK